MPSHKIKLLKSRVERKGKQFLAYDDHNNYLGCSTDKDEALYMAQNGFAKEMDRASELSLWTLWNDAINSGENHLVGDDGTQYLDLGFDVIMAASYENDPSGWCVELLPKTQFLSMNASSDFPGVLRLKVAEKPYKLE